MKSGTSIGRVAAGVVALVTATSVAVGLASTPAQADGNGRHVLHAKLTGAAERPGPGDPDGWGKARVFTKKGEADIICVALRVRRIDRATAAHIHLGDPGAPGPAVVTLTPPVGGYSKACAVSTTAVVAAILAKPSNYYVNVHNAAYPAGAIRGQLR